MPCCHHRCKLQPCLLPGGRGTSLLPTLSSLPALFSLHSPAFGDGDLLLPNTTSPRSFAFLPLPSEICCWLAPSLGAAFPIPSQISPLHSDRSCSHTVALVPKRTDPAHTLQASTAAGGKAASCPQPSQPHPSVWGRADKELLTAPPAPPRCPPEHAWAKSRVINSVICPDKIFKVAKWSSFWRPEAC